MHWAGNLCKSKCVVSVQKILFVHISNKTIFLNQLPIWRNKKIIRFAVYYASPLPQEEQFNRCIPLPFLFLCFCLNPSLPLSLYFLAQLNVVCPGPCASSSTLDWLVFTSPPTHTPNLSTRAYVSTCFVSSRNNSLLGGEGKHFQRGQIHLSS